MLGALCFGTVFGFPFIAWGLFLIFDRDRTWQKKINKSKSNTPVQRTRAWDLRQIIYGTLLVIFGSGVLIAFALFNLAAQSVSPPAPF